MYSLVLCRSRVWGGVHFGVVWGGGGGGGGCPQAPLHFFNVTPPQAKKNCMKPFVLPFSLPFDPGLVKIITVVALKQTKYCNINSPCVIIMWIHAVRT